MEPCAICGAVHVAADGEARAEECLRALVARVSALEGSAPKPAPAPPVIVPLGGSADGSSGAR